MGDVVHNLPVVNDIRNAFPDTLVDWVAEENFAAIPALHPHVAGIIPVGLRRWRKRLPDAGIRREIGRFRARLREIRYDAIIDTQGLLKSAILARMAIGPRHGLDWRSSREPLRFLYDRTYSIPWSLHAVERNRLLASKALGYELQSAPAYGIAARSHDLEALSKILPADVPDHPFSVLLHATSAASKEWPEARWIELGRHLRDRGIVSVLPFGGSTEQARSRRLAAQIPGALVPPALDLDLLAALLSQAKIVAGVDTGLTHLAVGLGRPTIGLYCATDPTATGLYGSPRAVNLGGIDRAPQTAAVIAAVEQLEAAR